MAVDVGRWLELPSLLLAAVAVLALPAGALESVKTQEFDVRPGGMVYSVSLSLGDLTCTFTYAAQGGTNEQWQMSIEMSEDEQRFFCTISRPLGKSYIFFTEFKADVEGGKIQYSEAYSQAAAGGQKDVALKKEEYEVSETAVTHKPGGFHSELSKLVIVARSHHSEL